MPRNRELTQVFKDVGLVEQLGSGMSRILNSYDRTVFEISEHFIRVIFPFSWSDQKERVAVSEQIGDDNGDDMKILLLLEREPDSTAKKLSEKVGFSTRKISRIIKSLRDAEKIIRVGSDRKGYWKVNR